MNERLTRESHHGPNATTPVVVRYRPESAELLITWDDGAVTTLGYAFLRERCRCAHCLAGITRSSGAGVSLLEAAPFGSYALRLFFDDGHDRGLYPFEYLRELDHTDAGA